MIMALTLKPEAKATGTSAPAARCDSRFVFFDGVSSYGVVLARVGG